MWPQISKQKRKPSGSMNWNSAATQGLGYRASYLDKDSNSFDLATSVLTSKLNQLIPWATKGVLGAGDLGCNPLRRLSGTVSPGYQPRSLKLRTRGHRSLGGSWKPSPRGFRALTHRDTPSSFPCGGGSQAVLMAMIRYSVVVSPMPEVPGWGCWPPTFAL